MPLRLIKDNKLVDCFHWDEGSAYDEPHSKIPKDVGLICWDNNPFCWDDVCLALEAGRLVEEWDGWLDGYKKLEKKKKKRFIRLIAKVKSQTLGGVLPVSDESKLIQDDIEVTADDVKLVIERVLNISVELEK